MIAGRRVIQRPRKLGSLDFLKVMRLWFSTMSELSP
jgi:hypothetical protein